MVKRLAVAVSVLFSCMGMLFAGNHYWGFALQMCLCGTISAIAILSLKEITESAIFAGSLIASLVGLSLLIAKPLVGQARSLESFLIQEVGVAAGALAACLVMRALSRIDRAR